MQILLTSPALSRKVYMSESNDAARSPWKDDEKFLDVNETTIANRVIFLQDQLVRETQALR